MGQIKLIHTSDWHLGKRLYRKEREPEHELFLKWLEEQLLSEKADVLLLAGDVFDSPTPPHNSLKLYYDFLKRVSDIGVHAVIISGNHDSQGLINAPQSLLKDKNITLCSRISFPLENNIVKLDIKGEQVWIKCMPYFRNYELIKLAQELELFCDDIPREEVFKSTLEKFFSFWPEGKPAAKILLSHHVFGNYNATGSEHFIGLTGIESIPLDMLKNRVDYAALGHIHQFQSLCEQRNVVYTGSPIQMRFSESKNKFINKIVFDTRTGDMHTDKTQIPIFRELIQIKTDSSSYIEKIRNRLESFDGELSPFVEVQMDMLEAKTGMVDVIKDLCEAQGASLLSFIPNIQATNYEQEQSIDIAKLDILQLFKLFYEEKFPEQGQLPPYLETHFKTLLEEASNEDS